MISLKIIIVLLFAHWVADFIFQTDWMAKGKSKSSYPRFIHCLVYTIVFGIICSFVVPTEILSWFLVFNGITHFVVDGITSKISSDLASKNKYGSPTIPNFGMFTVIGFDQFLHYVLMFSSYVFLINY